MSTTTVPATAERTESPSPLTMMARLDAVLRRAERRGMRSLSPEDAEALPGLYQQALSLREHARNQRLDRQLIDNLDNLTKRAALALRRPSEARSEWALKAALWTVPAAYWRERYHLLAGLLTAFIGACFGYVAVLSSPELDSILIPESVRALTLNPSDPIQMLMDLVAGMERIFTGNIDSLQIKVFALTLKTMAFCLLFGLAAGYPALFVTFGFSAMSGALLSYEQVRLELVFGAEHGFASVALLSLVIGLMGAAGMAIGSGLWRREARLAERGAASLLFVFPALIMLFPLFGALLQSYPLLPTYAQPWLLFVVPFTVFIFYALVLGFFAHLRQEKIR